MCDKITRNLKQLKPRSDKAEGYALNQLLGEQQPEQQAAPQSIGVRRRSWSAKSPEGDNFIFIWKDLYFKKPKVGTRSAPPSPRFLALALKLSPLDRPEIPTNPSPSMLVASGENDINTDWWPDIEHLIHMQCNNNDPL